MRHDPDLTDEDLVGVCIDFFEAGPEAVGNTLRFLILFLVLNPEWQDKCQTEVKEVLGRSHFIHWVQGDTSRTAETQIFAICQN